MMRSLYSGVAGLRTHQTKMDVIGNNIANVNTTSYKSQSISFSDLLYQTSQHASGANTETGRGGTNARQIGLGSVTGAIETNITGQGSAQTTNNPFDIMITGDSFFVVSDGSQNYFTRDGSFTVDGTGNLVMSSNGYTVMGWKADANGNIIQDTVSALKVMDQANLTYPPEATTKGTVSGILDKNDTNLTTTKGKIISMPFYDSLGYSYNAKFSIHPIDTDTGNFYIQLDGITDSSGNTVTDTGATFGSTLSVTNTTTYSSSTIGSGTVAAATTLGSTNPIDCEIKQYTNGSGATVYGIFDKLNETNGTSSAIDSSKDLSASITSDELLAVYGLTDTYSAANGYSSVQATYDSTTGVMSVTATKSVSNAMYVQYDPDTGDFNGINTTGSGFSPTASTGTLSFTAGNFSSIDIGFSGSTMFNNNGTSTISATYGDTDNNGSGRKIGNMSGISIAQDGTISASYDNGQTRVLGQISVANFANASGLEKEGDNLYSATRNSGDFDGIGTVVTSGGGKMTTGELEMSNVDLSREFTEMITTQRGFQANSRIITVSDTMLEELVNLKR
ncbi:MAG: flagellar hook-basal body complex protein [Lachnospiraceae bacterium]|nr:flagellar hook-basal body complex protein [Lachnospiraceae bacterium]